MLSATWESISEKILDSSLVKGVLDIVNGIASALDSIASIGDGAVVVVLALAMAFSVLQKLKLTSVFSGLSSGLKSVARSALSLILPLKTQAQVELEAAQAAQTAANCALIKAESDYNAAMASTTATAADQLKAKSALERAQAEKLVADATVESAESAVTSTNSLKNSLSQVASYAMLAYMAFSIVNSALEDTEYATEKGSDGATLMAVAIAAAITAVVIAVKIGAAAITGAIESIPIIGWVLMAISALTALGTLIASLCSSPSYDELKEDAEELQEEWQEFEEELEEVQNQIEELEDELEALQEAKAAAGYSETDTSAYDAEIKAIEAEIQELETLAQAKKDAAYSSYIDAVKATADALWGYDLGDISSMGSGDLASAISEYSELLEDYTYGENSLLDPFFEDYYKMLSKYAILTASTFAEGVGDVLNLALFTDAKDDLKDFANEFEKAGDITAESIKELAAENSNVQEFLDYLIELGAWDGESWDGIVEAVQSLRTSLVKLSRVDIADDIETLSDKFDALSDALDNVADSGVIALDTLETLLESYPSLLEKYFSKSIDGYVLNSDYSGLSNYDILKDMAITDLETYANALIDAQTALSKLTEDDLEYETALYNLAVAQDNLSDKQLEWATLLREAAIEEETDRLEAEQDALEDQLDAYQDLIDIRKDLLETYQEEVDYQKELASKQKTVSQLSTQLALSKLDTSAAGQARTRELQSELDEAQEELDDYALEHAIDVITEQLDAEEGAYEKWINKQIGLIDDAIDDLSTTLTGILTETGITLEDGTITNLAALLAQATANDKSDMAQLYNDLNNSDVSTDNTTAFQSAYASALSSGDYTSADSLYSAAKEDYDSNTTTEEEGEDDGYTATQKAMANNMKLLIGSSASGMKANNKGGNGEVSYHGNTYKVQEGAMPDDLTDMYVAAYNIRGSDDGFKDRSVFAYNNGLYAMCDGSVLKLEGRATSKKGYNNLYSEWQNNGSYHTGGFVGGLESNEEFAKLLRGEFVSTPAQMDRFMNSILPSMVDYNGADGVVYNAPLISIECGSVTKDSLPELKEIVDEAVSKIQKQIDSGLSRNGYKRTVNKFSSTS